MKTFQVCFPFERFKTDFSEGLGGVVNFFNCFPKQLS